MSTIISSLILFTVVFWGIIGVICWMIVKALR
jgi:hypothetical protein